MRGVLDGTIRESYHQVPVKKLELQPLLQSTCSCRRYGSIYNQDTNKVTILEQRREFQGNSLLLPPFRSPLRRTQSLTTKTFVDFKYGCITMRLAKCEYQMRVQKKILYPISFRFLNEGVRRKGPNFKMYRMNKILCLSNKLDACLGSSILLFVSLPLGKHLLLYDSREHRDVKHALQPRFKNKLCENKKNTIEISF